MVRKEADNKEALDRGNPKVSICIPCYNNAAEVQRLLFSITEQTFRDYEVILTDDSTNEEIAQLAERLTQGEGSGQPGLFQSEEGGNRGQEERPAERPPRLRYVHNSRPLGHIFNWNRALELAEGSYIKIMFSDDWFTRPDSLERMVGLLDADPQASLAFCGTMQVSESRSYARAPQSWYLERLRADYRHLFLGNEIGAPSATLYRACGALFDEKSNWASDMFLYFNILEKNPRFAFTAEPLISIGIHEAQYTGMFAEKDIRKYQDSLLMYQKYGLEGNELCRKEMLRLTVMFGQGWKTASSCGASRWEYGAQRVRWFWHNTVLGYWNGALYRIKRLCSGDRKDGARS